MTDLFKLGQNISKIRKERGFTQEQMAEKIGVTAQYVSIIENGRANISIQTFLSVCELLKVNPLVLIDDDMDMDLQRKIYYLTKDCSDRDREVILGMIISLKRLLSET